MLKKGQINVMVMAKGFFYFVFTCEKYILSILVGGPWMFGRSSLSLKKWELGFSPLDWALDMAPIWVRLPSLTLEFWDEEIFHGIATCFGELISVDPMIASRKQFIYVRIYVNIK